MEPAILSRFPSPQRWRRENTAAAVIIGLLFAAFYWPYIVGSSYFPYDFQGPHNAAYARNAHYYHNGGIPLWLPQFWGGISWCGIPETGLCYPLHLILYFGRPVLSLTLLQGYELVHILVGTAGAYVFARRVCGAAMPAVFGAVFFFGCGYLNGHLQHSTIVFQLAWLPWAFFFLIKGYQKSWLPNTLMAGLLFGLAGLVGSYIVYFAMIAAGLMVCFTAAWVGPNTRLKLSQVFLRGLILVAAYLVVSAASILPALQTGAGFIRGDYGEWSFGTDLRAMSEVIFPGLGYVADVTLDHSITIGVVPLLLAAFGARHGRRWTVLCVVIAVIFFVMGFGPPMFVSRLASRWLPAYAKIRGLVNAWSITQLMLCPLIAVGVKALFFGRMPRAHGLWRRHCLWFALFVGVAVACEALVGDQRAREPFARHLPLVVLFTLLAAAVGLYGTQGRPVRLRRNLAVGGMLLLAFVELGTVSSHRLGINAAENVHRVRHWNQQKDEISSAMAPEPLHRYDAFTGKLSGHVVSDYAGIMVFPYENAWGWHAGDMIPQNAYLLQALATNRAGDFRHLFRKRIIEPATYPRVFGWANVAKLKKDFGHPAYRLFGVRYVLDARPWGDLVLPGSPAPVSTQTRGRVRVYEIPNPLPRTFLVDRAQWHEHEGRYLEAVTRRDFDPIDIVHLWTPSAPGGEAHELEPRPDAMEDETDRNCSATIVHHEPDRLAIRVETDAQRWLLVSQNFAPGWRAEVDGHKVPVLRADFAFQAIAVPAGKHDVQFVYRPLSYLVGKWVTITGALVILTAWAGLTAANAGLLRRKRPQS